MNCGSPALQCDMDCVNCSTVKCMFTVFITTERAWTSQLNSLRINMGTSREYRKFDKTMETILKVPHSALKAALDAEKAARAEKRNARKPSASGRASRAKG